LSPEETEAVISLHERRLGDLVPEGALSLSGSTLLGHFGGHDIDFVLVVPDLVDAARRVRDAYPPLYEDEWRDDWAAFRDAGPPQVDVVVTTPGSKGEAHHLRAWQLLLNEPSLLAEYENLKAAGMTGAQKAAFFDRLVSLLEQRR
jgi:hypothetical protein